jgi:hypothetical protein
VAGKNATATGPQEKKLNPFINFKPNHTAMKRILLILIIFFAQLQSWSQTLQQLRDSALKFPAMPKGTADLIPFVGGLPTFSSGTPFNDLEFNIFDTDYMDGENSGGDVFMPVDPSDPFPGANKVKVVRCILNTDLNEQYGSANADRIILGTAEIPTPFFLRGSDGIDNDYAVILHMDYEHGYIQLRGEPTDYRLAYFKLTDGVKTEGWYLFYTANNDIDLVAFIFPCWAIEPAVSGNPPNNLNPICNSDSTLSLTNPTHFRYAQPISTTVSIPNGIAQYGSNGKEVVGGMTVDKQGNTYVIGLTDGNLDGNIDAANEIYVAKISPAGQRLWVTELPMKEGSYLKAATTDDDFIYVAGRTLGNLPGFVNAGKWDGILLKLNLSDGQIVAMNQWGNPGIDGYGCIVQDDDGHIFVSAQGSLPTGGGTDDVYLVAKHKKSDLSNVWRTLNAPNATGFKASAEAWGGLTYVKTAIPGAGRLIAAGWYIASGGANAFASVYENLNTTAPTRPHSIILASPGIRAEWFMDNTVDAQGNIYFAGFTTGNIGGNPIGEGDAFIAKYSPQLTNPVFKQFGTAKSDLISKIDIDANGIIYTTGYTYGNYGGNNNDPSGRTGDVFIQKFDLNLNFLGSKIYGTPHEDRGYSFLKDSLLYIAGMTEGTMCGTNQGSFDAYVFAVKTNDLSVFNPSVITSITNGVPNTPYTLYPNPANDFIIIKGLKNTPVQYLLYNQQAQLLTSGNNLTSSNNMIMLKDYPAGLYIIKLIAGNQSYSFKFTKN